MAGGCWICNPMCGKCQPAPMKSTNCPDCGILNIFERPKIMEGGVLRCKKCGADLTDLIRPKIVRCNYSGYLCAYPCGKSQSPKQDHQPCLRNTRPSDEWIAAHPKAKDLIRPKEPVEA